ncbi:hypothetical protein [Streptomyces sp. NPDC003401]
MSNLKLDKARAAALKAQQELADLEAAEVAKAEQIAAERKEKQRDLDVAFLAEWEKVDAELQESGNKSAADSVYEGTDPIAAVAVFWIARAKRNAVRQRAQEAYHRLHGEPAADTFAPSLNVRDMMIAAQLEAAISRAATLHAADLTDELDAKWLVGEDGA